jgi:putative ABC transport system ATP-binding protein
MIQDDILVATGLEHCYGRAPRRVCALQGVSLSVRAGELVLLVGRAGSGKTTLLNCCGGLLRPDSGRVTLAGKDLAALDGRGSQEFLRRSVGWVFQSSGLLPLMTAGENVGFARELLGDSRADAGAAATRALAAVGMESRALHRADELSGGEQQRVALARALVKDPQLLLADEPTAQLDGQTALEIWQLIREATARGTAVLAATHDTSVEELADRVLRIEDGKLT